MARRKKNARRAQRSATGNPRWISSVFWLGVLAVAAFFAWREVALPVMSQVGFRRVEKFAPLLREVASEFDVDGNLLAGIMLAESSGRGDAVSSADALGLFQLMLPTARERATLLGLDEPSRSDLLSDGALNARLAGAYVRWLAKRYDGQVEPMLVAYNTGPGRLDGWIKSSGSYAAWRAERDAPGESQVLGYALKVQGYRERFAERGVITPPVDPPPAPPVLSTAAPMYGPPNPVDPPERLLDVERTAAPSARNER